MIVRTLDECRNSERRVVADNWESVRMLLKDDNMGFSFHITTIYEGTETHIHYQNHLESVFCMSGEGEIEVVGGRNLPNQTGHIVHSGQARRALPKSIQKQRNGHGVRFQSPNHRCRSAR